jgi:hypothetical protein
LYWTRLLAGKIQKDVEELRKKNGYKPSNDSILLYFDIVKKILNRL